MTHSDDFIGLLEEYLETFDGTTPLPDRVKHAIRAELPSARQVRPSPGPERVFTMLSSFSALAKAGLAAAAVVVAVVLGGAFMNLSGSAGIVGGGPTPTPSSTATPSATPTPVPSVAVAPPLALNLAMYGKCDSSDTGNDCILPGTYQLTGAAGTWPATVSVDVPAGWFEWDAGKGWDALLVHKTDIGNSTGWGVMFTTVADVQRDPCDLAKGTIPAAQVDTPEKLAAAIATWPGFTATAPQPVTVDGHPGLELTLSKPVKGCDGGTAWTTTSGAQVDAYPMANTAGHAYPTTVRIIDTGNGLLVMRVNAFADTSPSEVGAGVAMSTTRHAGDLAGLQSIVDSVHIAPAAP